MLCHLSAGDRARRESSANINIAIMTFQDFGAARYRVRVCAVAAAAAANGAHANAYTYISASSLRSGMRSIARRIESGRTGGREGPGTSEEERRTSGQDGGNEKETRERSG